TVIAQAGDSAPPGGMFSALVEPSISNGIVAFNGTFDGGSGIFTGAGGSLTTIVTTAETTPSGKSFASFSFPTIGGDTVAFRGAYVGGSGIYTRASGALSKVIELGDPLFGSTVTNFTFSALGLDPGGSGNLAFTYTLADGRSGVALANSAPPLSTIYKWETLP